MGRTGALSSHLARAPARGIVPGLSSGQRQISLDIQTSVDLAGLDKLNEMLTKFEGDP
jgi:hypothetical protein